MDDQNIPPQNNSASEKPSASSPTDAEEVASKDELLKCRQECEEYLNGWKRAKADLANFKKEEQARAEAAVKFAGEWLLRDLVGIMDSFDLAISAEPDNKGLTLIRSQLESFLNKNGLVSVKSAGERFNPACHEAVGEVESDKESGMVVEEIERGWLLYDKVIRPARVKLAK